MKSESKIYSDVRRQIGTEGEPWHYEVGADADDGNQVQIDYHEHHKPVGQKVVAFIRCSPDEAIALADAIKATAMEIKAKNEIH